MFNELNPVREAFFQSQRLISSSVLQILSGMGTSHLVSTNYLKRWRKCVWVVSCWRHVPITAIYYHTLVWLVHSSSSHYEYFRPCQWAEVCDTSFADKFLHFCANLHGTAQDWQQRCTLLKRTHWKMLIAKMQISEKWHILSVNQEIPSVYPFAGYCSCSDTCTICLFFKEE